MLKHYWDWLEAQEGECCCETEERFSEKRWQTYLSQNRLGSRWVTQDGEVVEILHFGRCNREEGPDFMGALVKFGREAPVRGDLELDRDVRDWERHNHAQNGAYRNVLVHFFFEKPAKHVAFTRDVEGRQIRQVLLDPDQVQVSPFLRTECPIFAAVDLSDTVKLIEAAARFRMLRKQQGLRRKVLLSGGSEALFQAIASALGYRPNSLPFHVLARRVGIENAASPLGEALLFGVAGFLRGEEFMRVSASARKYLRDLWDLWWCYRDQFSPKQLSSQLWRRTSVRPSNYPERRIGALTLIARQFSLLQELVHAQKEAPFMEFMKSLQHPFWQVRSSFFLEPHQGCLLLGEERALDLLINVFYPIGDIEDPAVWNRFRLVRLPEVPQKIVEASSIFVGEGRLPRIRLREAVIQQGLLQMLLHFDRFDFYSSLKYTMS